jgi:tRNA G18 (ribose-2'-O)-methylase SpoU
LEVKAAMSDLFFLCSPAEFVLAEGSAGPLVMIKTSQTESMYIAATSRRLAERVLQLRPMQGVEIIATSGLPSKSRIDFSKNRVLVIDSESTLEKLLKGDDRFPYEQHAIYYER